MKSHTPGPWLKPFDAKVLAGLRPLMNQFTDGITTHLTPKKLPTRSTDGTGQLVPLPPVPVVCIPVAVSSILVDPVKDPYDLGDVITVTLDGLSGSTPYFYQWVLNSVAVSTSSSYVHTLVDGDVMNKDGSGLGVTFLFCFVSNACGLRFTPILGSINVQGLP